MHITNSLLQMSSERSYQESSSKTETVSFWKSSGTGSSVSTDNAGLAADTLELSTAAQDALDQEVSSTVKSPQEMKLHVLRTLLEAFTGKHFRFYSPSTDFNDSQQKQLQELKEQCSRMQISTSSSTGVGWGYSYDSYETYQETESTSFQVSGIVKTSDGQEIQIAASLNMSRSFYSYNELHIRAGDALLCDPLVINFSGSAAELTERNFSFDLDTDGNMDTISFLREGSGFLALDQNGDGIINDGSELFGPSSGDGFADLAQYDEDGNGWIDETDSIFDQLRIWTKDANGKDSLFALGQKGIGAICLACMDTEFSLTNSSNELNGKVVSSGIFLKENGTVGTMQQIDLRV